MGKRRSSSQLNHETNLDVEDEPEDGGEYKKADVEELKNRVIKTAKRKLGSESTAPTNNIFSTFSGFGIPPQDNKPANAAFSFLSNLMADKTKSQDEMKPKDLDKLVELNTSCSKWIAEQISKNPNCILSPIFKDYEKYLAKLDLALPSSKTSSQFGNTTILGENKTNTDNEKNKSSAASSDLLPAAELKKPSEPLKATETKSSAGLQPIFSFSFATSSTNNTNLKSDKSNEPATESIWSFKPNQPFTSGGVNQLAAKKEEKPDDTDGDYEPPESDFKPVSEDGSIFDIKCKVFEKKGDTFKAVGVGIAYLKPTEANKFQLLVRAETAQGQALLNVLVTPDHPIQATGKNNVLIVCVPKPDAKPPPIPVLIRVKNETDRDRLLNEMLRLKNG